MPRKRKLNSNQTTSEPLKKQQQTQKQPQQIEAEAEAEAEEEEYEEVDEEYEEVEEEYEEVEEEEEETDEDETDDDESISELLEPLSKDQLITLLSEAADSHSDVLDRVRKLANKDPVHRKIFVHGLRWDTTNEILLDEFKRYGEIEECKTVVDKVTGKSKGYGFILFRDRVGARNALREPQKMVCNRMVSCQFASVGPVGTWREGGVGEGRKIYVSNVGKDLDPGKLFEFFRKFGEIEEGPLGFDRASGKPKGFCLFVYRTAEGARKALEEPHKKFEGHVLHCQIAADGPKNAKGKQKQQQHQQNQNPQSGSISRNENPGFVGGAAVGLGHLMPPSGPVVGFNQGAAVNPALGQALTMLLSNPAAGLGLTSLLGLGLAAGANPSVPGAVSGIPGGYPGAVAGILGGYGQANISQGIMGGFGNQGMQGGNGNQPMGSGGAGRGQRGQYGGASHNMGR